MIKPPWTERQWRIVLLPLTLGVPICVCYEILLPGTPAPPVQVTGWQLVSALGVAVTFWATGTLLLWRRAGQLAVRLFFLMMQFIGLGLLFFLAHPQAAPLPPWLTALKSMGFHAAGALVVHYYLTFPTYLGTPRQRRWLLSAIYGLMLVALLFRLTLTTAGTQISFFYNTLEICTAVVILIYNYRWRATADGRRRLRLVVFGNVSAFVPSFFFYLLPTIAGSTDRLPDWTVGPLIILTPLSYLYAIIRHNLFGIDRVLNRTLVYAILSIGILLLYAGPLWLIYHFLPSDLTAQLIVLTALTLIVGLSFDRTRTRVQRGVDRLFYGGWYDYPGVVETISDALAQCVDRVQLAAVLTQQVPDLMQLRGGQFWIGADQDEPEAKIALPQIQIPLLFEGRVRGRWTIGPRRDDEDFTTADRRIFKTLARQAQTALSNVLLIETLRQQLDELHASRETLRQAQHRLLRSREEERARLARDLHDGPLQVLVGLNMQLGLLLTSMPRTTPQTEELGAMRAEVRGLLTDLRHVCTELRPPMLDTLGLGAAIRALVEEWSAQHNLPVHCDLPPDGALRTLPGEVAVNVYRVVQEALTNVAHHAGACTVTVRLTWQADCLALTIHDTGRGFITPPTFQALTEHGHYGLVGMRERVNLIGGTLRVDSLPGQGTTVDVTCPIGE